MKFLYFNFFYQRSDPVADFSSFLPIRRRYIVYCEPIIHSEYLPSLNLTKSFYYVILYLWHFFPQTVVNIMNIINFDQLNYQLNFLSKTYNTPIF